MRRMFTLPALTVAAVGGSFFVAVSPASAHGYVSSPPSRQANCASGAVSGCGDIVYEPQSVENPKGSMQCNGGGSRFAVLNDNSRNWPAATVGTSVTFNWVLTARHRTSTWEYFIGGKQVASFNDNGAQPGAAKSHTVDLSGYSGRQTVLARWNVADTINAFYSCVDVNIGGGTNPTPAPTPSPTVTPPGPTPAPTATSTSGTTTWAAGTAYRAGDRVTFNGAAYQCRQAHTALAGWEPPYTAALWTAV